MTATDLGRVQRASVYAEGLVVLELYRGERHVLVLDGRTGTLHEAPERPPRDDETPPAVQKVLRQELAAAVLLAVEETSPAATRLLLEQKGGKRRSLWLERDRSDPRVVLCAAKPDGDKVLAILTGEKRPRDGRDVRKGRRYEPPMLAAPPPETSASAAVVERQERPRAASWRRPLKEEERRLARLEKKLRGDLSKHGDAEQLFEEGELLKGVVFSTSRGARHVDLPLPTGEVRPFALDPSRGPAENLELVFKRARRAREAARRVGPRLDEVLAQRQELAALREQLERAPDDEAAAARLAAFVARRASGGGLKARVRPKRGTRLPYRTFVGSGGVPIKVGRSARDNDDLTFHHARGNDTWLHCRDVQGSHVVVPVPPETLPGDLLIDAAHLAAHFSSLRGEERADVQYAAKKHIRKPAPGAPPGLVFVSREKVVHLVVDPGRLARLLASEEAPPA